MIHLYLYILYFNISGYSTPLHLLLYSVIAFSLVWFLLRSQTIYIIKIRKLLVEKELILLKTESKVAELETQQKSITDSLNYAQRIQEALLPSEDYFRKYFEDSFIYYRPKDIVSGDFFWIGEQDDKIFVAVADCTGHGVPGALMAMIGHELLDNIINVRKIFTPATVLEVMSEGLEKTFSREKNVGTIIRDGMDIGLCVIDPLKKKIQFAGAFLPLYIIRDNHLTEVIGDKYALGMKKEGLKYANNEIDLMEDDMLYLFSDGYADQFGGTENKKFMYRRFRYLLLTIYRFPAADQKSILEENFRTWTGNSPQIDDILVLGFKPLKKKQV